MKTIREYIGISLCVGLMVGSLFSATSVGASPQPTFKMEIFAPECVLDTIDDGSGPVLVATCPPGTVDPNPGTGDNVSNEDESTDIVATQRMTSPADTLAMLEILRSSGMSVELPEGFTPSFQVKDTFSRYESSRPQILAQDTFSVTVVVATVVAATALVVATSPALSAPVLDVVRRIRFKWWK